MDMDIRPLRTEADYDWALAQIALYFAHQPPSGTRTPSVSTCWPR